ncbi:hypothetical protein BDF20DRAFT_878993 [Mycotypha africana]|uniref:uncharacterized protein n=1 Tax=Mycotypha africana TaxID=64632 RepID=UPI00230152DF|nr:uncharacterized protein BDF20DRAFT_878993 [Mycotypha africana]KAI8975482.1 hypothetical protein BDF20DRAFT_878993 [Mycotypha africana]
MRVSLLLKDPHDNEKYELVFLTNEAIWKLLKEEISEFDGACTSTQLARWIANDGSWDQLEREVIDNTRVRGRHLYLLRSQYRTAAIDNVENVNSYKAFAHVDAERWMIVGYARKSISKEDDTARCRLLNLMITKLRTKLFCGKVFVSPFSNADANLKKETKIM